MLLYQIADNISFSVQAHREEVIKVYRDHNQGKSREVAKLINVICSPFCN